jgi:hypothetical protein
MNAAAAYLRIPNDYEGNRYSLSWAPAGDAIERNDRRTFVFAGAIALFLEGYASVGRLIHFSYVLYLLQRLDSRVLEPDEPGLPASGHGRELLEASDKLALAFQKAGRPFRSAGALCAWLCQDIPPILDPPDSAEVCLRLSNGPLAAEMVVWRTATAKLSDYPPFERPPLSALEFEMRFLNALKKLGPEEIACWLKHGRGPSPDPGKRVAEAIVALKPRTLEGTLATLSIRERFSGAVPMVSQLVGALTLPPRRLAHQALPSGGYADVATRGRPEQILPSQFAVDEIEFLRRFAENELLYFHREEPHAPLTEELVLVLDQGVRTWGRVRHALNASALAFGKLAARRKISLLFATTGSPGRMFDPLRIDEESLGRLWEASDLTPNPALALEEVLEDQAVRRRDVVVLSHPRSVQEADFAVATRRGAAGTRVFSVSIDEPGQVQFREWRSGVSIKVGEFRVDFSPPSGQVRRPATSSGPDPRGWRGDVEPVPFPFRFGVTHKIERPLFDFDHVAEWLLLCTQRGILHAWKLDGAAAEVLPRAMVDGEVLEQVDVVLGVAEGFVVGGRIGKSQVAMHYDFASRTAKAYSLGPTFDSEWAWFYCRDVHIVVARGKPFNRAVDLSNREIHQSKDSTEGLPSRVHRAFDEANNHFLPPPRLPVLDEIAPEPSRGGYVRLDRQTGEVRVARVSPPWEPFTPLANGKPSLKNCWLEYAQWRGDTLALLITGPGTRTRAFLFRGPKGIPIRELAPLTDQQQMVLSSDGRLIARRLGERQIEVSTTSGVDLSPFVTTKGKTHTDLRVTLGRYGLLIHVGKHVSLIRWDREKLTVSTASEGSTRSEIDSYTWPLDRPATPATSLPAHLRQQSHRFVACARAELTAVVDVFGQIALFDKSDRLLAMFLAFRGQVAAWAPDGTRFAHTPGSSPPIDGPETRNAAEIIGRALKEAAEAREVKKV